MSNLITYCSSRTKQFNIATSAYFATVSRLYARVAQGKRIVVSPQLALSDPQFDARSNVLGTINHCEASWRAGVRRLDPESVLKTTYLLSQLPRCESLVGADAVIAGVMQEAKP